jgi:hypothetical protein
MLNAFVEPSMCIIPLLKHNQIWPDRRGPAQLLERRSYLLADDIGKQEVYSRLPHQKSYSKQTNRRETP